VVVAVVLGWLVLPKAQSNSPRRSTFGRGRSEAKGNDDDDNHALQRFMIY
jgi:hypothetical protein